MAFSFGSIQYIFGLEITSLTNFIIICICFLLLSTLTEFLNLLQTNLYKFNLERKQTSKSDNVNESDDLEGAVLDTVTSSSDSELDNNEDNHTVNSSLIKKLPFSFAETNSDYQFFYSSKYFKSSKATEAKFNRLMFLIEILVYFFQTVISYALMQAIMSENFWIFISIVLGYMFGYFLFYNDLSLNLVLFAKLFEIYKRNLN